MKSCKIIVVITTVAVTTIKEMNIMMYMTSLSIITRYSRTFFERRLSTVKLGFTEHIILMHVTNHDLLNQEQIARHFMIDKGAIAKALGKLEKKNYITRTDNPNNKREKLIQITELGGSLIEFLKEELLFWNNCLFEGLSTDEIEMFISTSGKIADNAVKTMNERDIVYEDKK